MAIARQRKDSRQTWRQVFQMQAEQSAVAPADVPPLHLQAQMPSVAHDVSMPFGVEYRTFQALLQLHAAFSMVESHIL
jgi:hypothetical protein